MMKVQFDEAGSTRSAGFNKTDALSAISICLVANAVDSSSSFS